MKSFVSSTLISHRAMAATRIQRVTRSTFKFAYSKVYAAAVLETGFGVSIDYIKSIRYYSFISPSFLFQNTNLFLLLPTPTASRSSSSTFAKPTPSRL